LYPDDDKTARLDLKSHNTSLPSLCACPTAVTPFASMVDVWLASAR
jgi:hypothetical protein